MDAACCTCAQLLAYVSPIYDEKTEKPKAQDRRLDCCGRIICGNCIHNNSRFTTYCKFTLPRPLQVKLLALRPQEALDIDTRMNTGPFCQVSTTPSPLPQGLKDPPSYTPPSTSKPSHLPPSYTDSTPDSLPPYSSLPNQPAPPPEKPQQPAEDVLHFLDHKNDTLTSLSFRYNVPIGILRRANNLTSDHLLLARRTVIIPGDYYKGGVSLSPRPVEGEDEERRKAVVRRWMVACKVSEYVRPYTFKFS